MKSRAKGNGWWHDKTIQWDVVEHTIGQGEVPADDGGPSAMT